MNEAQAKAIAEKWHSRTVADQTFEDYLNGLHRRYCSYTGNDIASDVVSVVSAVLKLEQPKGIVHESHHVED